MNILAIDPGSEQSGYVLMSGMNVLVSGKIVNDDLLSRILNDDFEDAIDIVVIEWTAPRGMPASSQLFETLYWVGRFAQACDETGLDVERFPRAEVKKELCGTAASKDANVRQALIDIYGGSGGKRAAVGLKASPGPLYGVKADAWQALALAVAWTRRVA